MFQTQNRAVRLSLSLILSLFLSHSIVPGAWATLFIKPYTSTGGSVSNESSGGGTFYYFVKTFSTSGRPNEPSFMNVPALNVSPGITANAEGSALTNQFEVEIRTDKTYSVPTGQQAIITIQAIASTSGSTATFKAAPIASVNGVQCNEGNCMVKNPPAATNVPFPFARYYAARFYPGTNNKIRIGFYLSDICYDFNKVTSGTAIGCTQDSVNSSVIEPTGGLATTMQLTFSTFLATDGNANSALPTSSAIETTSNPITMNLQIDTPDFACTDQSTLNNSVTPGDGSISVKPVVGISRPNGGADVKSLYVVGSEESNPFVDTRFASNAIYGTLNPAGGTQVVSGFTNSTATVAHSYNLSFVVLDYAGIYTPPQQSSTCMIQGVQTAEISGVIPSGKKFCFIATAAFGSSESEPVLLLRKFRDAVLLKSTLGQGFVDWYYRWSPPAAEWLIENPVFKLPVLLFLAPLQALAWVLLNPIVGVVGITSGMLLLLSILFFSAPLSRLSSGIRRDPDAE
jgi:hypothetical protein